MERGRKPPPKGSARKSPSGGRAMERVRQFAESRGVRIAGKQPPTSSPPAKKRTAKPRKLSTPSPKK